MILALLLAVAIPAEPAGKCVLDQARALSAADFERLESICEELDRSGAGQLEIAVVDDLGDLPVDDYATALFEKWRIGHKGRADGLLVVLKVGAPGERDVRVRVGYGLEGALPDGKVGALIDRLALPSLKEGRWGEGLIPLAEALSAETKKENLSGAVERRAKAKAARDQAESDAGGAGVLMFLALVLWLAGMLALGIAKRVPGNATRGIGALFALGGLAAALMNWAFVGAMLFAWAVFSFFGILGYQGLARHRCPKCGGWLRITTRVIEDATFRSSGRGERHRACTKCDFDERTGFVIPRKQRTVVVVGGGGRGGGGGFGGFGGGGGGGGGFGGGGGGSTGGGGAGRSF